MVLFGLETDAGQVETRRESNGPGGQLTGLLPTALYCVKFWGGSVALRQQDGAGSGSEGRRSFFRFSCKMMFGD
jgi:hypothetical protein